MIEYCTHLAEQVARQTWHFLRQRTILGLFMALSAALAQPDSANAQDEPPAGASEARPETSLQLDTFDAVWNHVRDDYFDYARIESDWIEARNSLRPEAAESDRTELRALLNRMLDGIGESHFLVLPPTGIPAAPTDSDGPDQPATAAASRPTGLGVRLMGDALVIDRVGDVNADLIKPGWELIAIDDEALDVRIQDIKATEETAVRERAKLILEASANERIAYPVADEEASLTLRDTEGKVHTVAVRTREEINLVRIGNLPGLPYQFRSDFLWEQDRCIATISFTTWLPLVIDSFMDHRELLFACQGLVIDLRGNLGGVLTTMVPLTAHLVSEPVLLGQLEREDGRIDFRAFPRRVADDGSRLTPFSGPIAILIDSLSASTSEMFTAGMQALGRARVFGTPSPGMALPAQMLPLPNGDRLMYAFADYTDSRGRRIEGVGVTPDEVIETRRSDLIDGTDPVMKAALTWLQTHSQEDKPQ